MERGTFHLRRESLIIAEMVGVNDESVYYRTQNKNIPQDWRTFEICSMNQPYPNTGSLEQIIKKARLPLDIMDLVVEFMAEFPHRPYHNSIFGGPKTRTELIHENVPEWIINELVDDPNIVVRQIATAEKNLREFEKD